MITVKNVSKNYRIYHSPADRLKEIVTRKKYHKDLKALSGISFTVSDGETLGIVGENGAGKSTLLKILQGVIIPDEGEVSVTGKVTGLLELGTGFNSELSGVENIYMNGTMLGMSREELDAKKDEIINFTELGDAINDPIKTYSSGMLMRLGFSIAIHADPACFLVDEALSVGDAYFQQKCMRAIQAFKEKGGSIIFVSHDMNAVKTLCDAAIFLENGKLISSGSPKDVTDVYINNLLTRLHQGENKLEKKSYSNDLIFQKDKISTDEVIIRSLSILNKRDETISNVVSGDLIKIVFEVESKRDFDDPHYGFIIRNNLGLSVYESNTLALGVKTVPLFKGDISKVIISWNVPLFPGDYSISLGIANGGYDHNLFREYLLNVYDVSIIKILRRECHSTYSGIVDLKPDINVECLIQN